MPFGRSKTTHRTPLQRLNDSRRSLALAGLAAGATVAAIFRRKKGKGEAEFDAPIPTTAPEPATPAAPFDSGPPAAIDIPPAASEPAVAEPSAAPEPAAADEPATPDEPSAPAEPADRSSASEAPAKASSSSIVEPATGELSAEEASILAVLAQSGRIDDDRTALAVATSLERETTDVAAVLRKLGAEGVVSGELYTASGDKIWAVTERGVRRLGAQH